MHEILDAVELFFDRLTAVHWGAVVLAVGFHLLKMVAVSQSWRNIIAAAYPRSDVRLRNVFGAYAAGVGVNAVLPARVGDVLKLYLAKHRIAGATYPTLTATLLVQTIFDIVIATALFLWALSLGVLPSRERLATLGPFDFSWLFANPHLPEIVAGLLLIGIPVAVVLLAQHIEAFKRRVTQGFAALREPHYYLRHVVPWQALDWTLRLCSVYFFLRAFGVDANLHNALLTQTTHSLSTIFPFSPSGVGTEQALIVYVLRGEASVSSLIAFGVGMKLIVLAVNVAVGAAAIALMLRTFRMRDALTEARRDRADVPG